jgi:FKBP-type peptidyl-prolyl cis-trans isomerase FkpA
MKQKIFTFLLIAAAGLTACKKNDSNQPNIREFDEQKIQDYISASGLTGFSADTTKDGIGTTGIHYKIISQGTGDSLKYSDNISLVYTMKSFDGKYTAADTISNHFTGYLGQLTAVNQLTGFRLPPGLQLAIHNLLQYKGSSMRVLIPSRLGYGVNGFGSGSISNVNTRIAGNQSLDFYVHVISNQDIYDDKVIYNFITANNLTGYAKDFSLVDSSGIQVKKYYYYKIITPGTGTIGDIKEFTNVTATYNGYLLNGTGFDTSFATTTTTFTPYQYITGVADAIQKHASKGTSISILVPPSLGYGDGARTGIPGNSVLKFEFQITEVKQP